MAFFRLLLFPLSLLYGLLMQLRNFFYEIGLFRSKKFTCPVISVGNITSGGSGKTPFTVYLVRKLQKMGYRPAVVSRGYGRKSQGVVLVSDGQTVQPDVRQTGDEPLLIARSLPGTVVVVGEERSMAIEKALQFNATNLIVMDDGFQHRAVKRDIDIVLTAWPGRWTRHFILPAGDLREFTFNLNRADFVVRTSYAQLPPEKGADYGCHFTGVGLRDLSGKRQGALRDFSGERSVAFCGIAQPRNFEKLLRDAGLDIRGFISLADHAPLTVGVIERVLDLCREQQASLVLCTEKDWVKIAGNPLLEQKFDEVRCFHTHIRAVLNDEIELLKNIETILDSLN